MKQRKKLIEVALPLEAINKAAAREKSIRHGHPSTLHLWWARRPLAAARAVIFAQMVDDPSEYLNELKGDPQLKRKAESVLKQRHKVWQEACETSRKAQQAGMTAPPPGPEPTLDEILAEQERQRLFRIIEDLVLWENTTNEEVLEKARAEIWQSWRRTCAQNAGHPRAKELFNRHKLPAFHDPFAGGGALPLEAQRLGLEAYASDLNPVAVLINKAMIEIPPKFAGMPPVNPESRRQEVGNSEKLKKGGKDALSGTDRLAEGDGGSERDLSTGPESSARGDLRNAIADHPGSCVDSGQHSGGVGAGVRKGKGAVPVNSTGVNGGDRDAPDPVRADRVVSGGSNATRAHSAHGGRQDAHNNAQKPQVEGVGNSGQRAENSNQEIENGTQEIGGIKSNQSPNSSNLFPISLDLFPREWKGAAGLAEDVRYYGKWMRDEAEKRIGHLYPKIEITAEMATGRPDLKPYVGQKLTVIAWLWARTVKSPNPAFAQVDVPLVSTFMLSTKPGKEAYVDPVIENGGYRFTVKVGTPADPAAAKSGTKMARANFACIMSGTPVSGDYIKSEGKAGRMGARLMAIVAEGAKGRVYLSPTAEHEAVISKAKPTWRPEGEIAARMTGGNCTPYGLTSWGDLFTPRQLVALTTFSDLVGEAIERVKKDATSYFLNSTSSVEVNRKKKIENSESGTPPPPSTSHFLDTTSLSSGGTGSTAYAEAVGVYLAFAVDKGANYWSSLCSWHGGRDTVTSTFGRQALPMIWDFAEANPFSSSSGNYLAGIDQSARHLNMAPGSAKGVAEQLDAAIQRLSTGKVLSTDPPYYDNIGYADLSDFFYVWLRQSLRPVFPHLFATLAVPKAAELVATPYRHGSKEKAEEFFLSGMTQAMHCLAENAHLSFPVSIYYAFRQSENQDDTGTASTGWETFLDAVIRADLGVNGTWPMRTEYTGNLKKAVNALASSIVLVCRPRSADAPTATRREFVTTLQRELPEALRLLQKGNIAPVDLAQASIGPGMAVFTRYAKVLDAQGKTMTVREALALINQILDEALAEQEGDFDADSRWALAWFDQNGFEEGEFGVADVLARAKNTAVEGLVEAGIVKAGRGRVRLLRPGELPADWDPAHDARLTAWEMVHQLIRVLGKGGERAAARLVAQLGSRAEVARELAYRLYTTCERKKRATEALSYNALVQSWPEIVRLAKEGFGGPEQDDMLV